MKITICQLNPTIGDIKGNLEKMKKVIQQNSGSDLVVFPELFLVGYPPRDLLERKWVVQAVEQAIDELKEFSKGFQSAGILFGAPVPTHRNFGRGLYNTGILIHQGKIIIIQRKSLLPTYDVFDEARYFEPGEDIDVVKFKDEVLGISICEDAWNISEPWQRQIYKVDPINILAKKGATVFINISASPFYLGKEKLRFKIFSDHALKYRLPFIMVNQIGANDELIFDGRSMFIDRNGFAVDVLPAFEECVKTVDTKDSGNADYYRPQDEVESLHNALVLGIRDYMRKCGFEKAIIGLSGGIDSAITCYLASRAIGPENVLSVTMPGPYSSKSSIEDSRKLVDNLGIKFMKIPISQIFSAYLDVLTPHFKDRKEDITEENIQARIRGNILMALSNKFGYLVLSTGNKSELAVGYCTLYGDMTGGLAVISDVPKTMVYKLADFINRKKEIIPVEIIKKVPSAELKPGQTDQDILPPYEILDQVLHYYVDEGYSVQEIINKGFEPDVVRWIVQAVDRNEYKRRQAAPGLKVTTKAFGMGRRMVIAAKYEY